MRQLQHHVLPRATETRLQNRNVVELLRNRTTLLDEEERALMRMYLDGGQSVRRIATLAGTSPTTISRRIRKISKRLMDPTYLTCLQKKVDFNTLELTVIRDHFVRGLSIAAVSRRHNITYYRARTAVHKGRHYTTTATR